MRRKKLGPLNNNRSNNNNKKIINKLLCDVSFLNLKQNSNNI